jgi:hypothetical protein
VKRGAQRAKGKGQSNSLLVLGPKRGLSLFRPGTIPFSEPEPSNWNC